MIIKQYPVDLTLEQIGHLKAAMKISIWDIDLKLRTFDLDDDQKTNLIAVKDTSQSILMALENLTVTIFKTASVGKSTQVH